MKNWRTAATAALLAAPLLALTTGSATATLPTPDAAPGAPGATRAPAARAGTLAVTDKAGDVAKRKLDIRRVTVRNTARAVTVRVYFPGVSEEYDYPLGYVSVWLDTDYRHAGPEYGHFTQMWSDYRFAETKGWRESPTPAWGHSPEGECVEDARLRGDAAHELRYFEYVVTKREGCFEAGPVRVAVTTVNEGENHPYRPYDRAYADHLGKRHAWTAWVRQAG